MDHLSQLPTEDQERLALQIEEVLDEALWDAQFADPRSEAFFDAMVAEAERGPLLPLPIPADMGDEEPETGN